MKYAEIPGPTLPLRNSPEPFHTVTHRAIGDIPGCTPAPRSGTYIPVKLEAAKALTMARAEVYSQEVMKYVTGEYGGDHGYEDMQSGISRRLTPMFGAYGEKL